MPKFDGKEKQNYEFKQSWQDEALKEIVSFANSDGGTVYIGVDDSGEIIGLANSKDLMEKIPNQIHDILGLILPINLKNQDGIEYIEIEIPKSGVPISCRGKYYKRSGSTKRELTGNELNRFIQSYSDTDWEAFIVDDATFDDLDTNTISIFRKISEERLSFSKETNSDIELLEKLGLIVERKITRAALLLFGTNPQKHFTASTFKIGKFNSGDELIAQDIISGNLFNQIEEVIEVLKTKYLIFDIKFEGMKRVETLEYPIKALREIIVNALIHKDYMGTTIQMRIHPDKLEIWNEGKLPESITVEKLFENHPSKPRNELMAKVFFYSEYIDAWGRGINKILDACKDADLPSPEFKEDFGGLQVTLFKDIFNDAYLKKLKLNERQILAVKFTKENLKITRKEYTEINNVSEATAKRDLEGLVDEGIIELKGEGRASHYILESAQKRLNRLKNGS